MKKKIINTALLATLGLLILFTACRKNADTTLEQEIPQKEITTIVEKEEADPIILDNSNWIELTPNVYVTSDYYNTPLHSDNNDRFYGNCPTCVSGCSCPSGWNCNDGDCISSTFRGNATINWYSSGHVHHTKNSFMHQRYADCTKNWHGGCSNDKDNRFYFSYRDWMADPSKLRVRYDGGKSWWCSSGPVIDYLKVNGFRYVRVTTGEYCPTNNVRLVKI